MIDGAEHEGVSGLSVDDALKDMVILGANSQDLILSGQCPRNPLLAVPQLRAAPDLGQVPLLCHAIQQ